MASLHKQPGKPFWFCAFTDHLGQRHFRSTGTTDKKQAAKICAGWVKTADLAGQQNLTTDRARKLIESTVKDIMESTGQGLSNQALKSFFEKAAEIAGKGQMTKERLSVLIGGTVGDIVTMSGQALPNATIREWCKRWLECKAVESEPRTHERYETSIRRFLDFIGDKADRDLVTLQMNDVLRFRDDTAKRLSVTTTNLDLKVLRACLYSAMKQDFVQTNVAAKVDTLKQRGENQRRAFTLEEVRKVLAQCDKAGGEWRGLVLVAVYTRQRLGDVARLTWSQVDLAKKEISFVTRKTGKRLCMALAEPLAVFLEAAPSADDPAAYVFPNAAATVEIKSGTLSTQFYEKILVPAGLVPARPKNHAATSGKGRDAKRAQSEISFHSFRHCFTTWLKSAGASNALAQMIVGHDSEVVSRGYTHLGAEDTAAAIKKLPDVTR